MRGLPAVLIALTVACSQTGPPAAVKSTPSPAQTAIANPSPSPVPGDLPLTQVSFSCRLPISTPDNQGAFVSFPTRAVSIETKSPGVAGSWGVYYDRAFSRWLPVPRQAVSPDGRYYAYGERGADQSQVAKMHVVDIATGVDHVFATPNTDWFIPFAVLEYASEGIYLYTTYEVSIGVSLMNPITGAIHPVVRLIDVQASGGNQTFWVGTVNPADPSPLGGIEIQPNQIDRYSLADSTRVAWFYRPGTAPRVIGSDTQGHPIVLVVNGRNGSVDGDYGAELILLVNPQTQRSIYKGSAKLVSSMFVSISDSHGSWFGTDHGIYLYSGTAFMKVSNQPGYLANGCF